MTEPRPAQDPKEITRLLQQSRRGCQQSNDQLIEVVYRDLRKIAGRMMAYEGPHTLQPTALVHEFYLKVFRPEGKPDGEKQEDWQDRAHFFAVAALQMRRMLVDHARKRRAEKRGGGLKVALEDITEPSKVEEHDVEEVDEALKLLGTKDPRAAKLVELKYFGGLKDREIADVLGISFAQVRRDWVFARSWLTHELQKGQKS